AGAPAETKTLLPLLGVDDTETELVQALVDDLWARALLWRGSDGTHVVRTVPDVLGPSVAGLGPSFQDLRPAGPVPTEAELRTALAEVPDASRAVLDRLAWGPAVGVRPTGTAGPTGTPGPAGTTGTTALRWLLE